MEVDGKKQSKPLNAHTVKALKNSPETWQKLFWSLGASRKGRPQGLTSQFTGAWTDPSTTKSSKCKCGEPCCPPKQHNIQFDVTPSNSDFDNFFFQDFHHFSKFRSYGLDFVDDIIKSWRDLITIIKF